jgi:hypothetical protein
MELLIDPDVKAVAEFMQFRLPAVRLVSVARAVSAVAPLLWGHYESEELQALQLVSAPPISSDGPHT